MSTENVEIVRRGWDAWMANDVDALFDLFHPDIEWDTTTFEGWPESGVYKGRAAVREFVETWRASWSGFDTGVDRIVDAGDDRVVALVWQSGAGPGSHAPVRMEWAQVLTLRDGLVVRIEGWSGHAPALESVGLRAA